MSIKIQELARDTRGAGFVEYIILVGLVALVGIACYTTFGEQIDTKVTEQADAVQGIVTP